MLLGLLIVVLNMSKAGRGVAVDSTCLVDLHRLRMALLLAVSQLSPEVGHHFVSWSLFAPIPANALDRSIPM